MQSHLGTADAELTGADRAAITLAGRMRRTCVAPKLRSGRLSVVAMVQSPEDRHGHHLAISLDGACARSAMRSDPYGRALYDAMRARGLGHERALRGLADRLLTCLISTLRHDQIYDPSTERGTALRHW